jgi:glycerol-3-phosphate dehydrogenase (NAD(P)+)
MAAPTQYSRNVLEILKKYFNPDSQILVNVAKGIENSTLMRISEICRDVLGDISYCVLSGPSHAEEVARNCPTAVAAASDDIKVAEKTQKIFMADFFRVYTSQDIISVELGGALKNVMAIASGVVDGMKTGDNAKAALITRGIAEMSRLGAALGGNRDTFAGLSGTGDLIVTCMSGHSRNRHVGEELGRGRKLEKILADMGMSVAEGVKTTKSAYELALANNVETPIINEVYNVLYKGRDPSEALNYLMTRNARHELD